MPYKYGPHDYCTFVNSEKIFYPEILKFTENFPPLGSCIFKEGKYYFRDYAPDLSNLPPVFESGDYQLECSFSLGEELVNGYKVYADVLNMPSGK